MGGGGEIIYLSLHCHHQNDSCIKMGSDESHVNVSVGSDGQSHKTVSTNHNLNVGNRTIYIHSTWSTYRHPDLVTLVRQFCLGVRLVSKGTSVRICFGSPFPSKVVLYGHCLVTLSLTIMKQ